MAIALAASLLLLALAIGATLTRAPPSVARWNAIETPVEFGRVTRQFADCQGNEALPAGTTAIRLSLDAVLGPRVRVRVLQGTRLLTSGERGAGWTAADVTVPVHRVARTAYGVRTCFALSPREESVGLTGERLAHPSPATPGAIKIEYLRPGTSSWWTLASTVAAHLELGHTWSGDWLPVFLLAAMVAIGAAVSLLALQLAR